MRRAIPVKLITAFLILTCFLSGCSFLSGLAKPAPKPETGPAGKPVESKPNPPFMERFFSAPAELYDLEATAGVVFEGINKEDWSQAQAGLINLQSLWQQVKTAVGDKKGVKEGDEGIQKLTAAVNNKKITDSYENLNKFMGSVSDIGKSYKLSPIADIIAVDNGIRNVSFFVEDKDWVKAAAKVKELQGTWEKVKPSMEQVGILGEVTKTHSTVNQMKDAVNAENKGAFQEQLASINESMGRIRDFFRGK
ncbi:hypothetical protein [Sporomusa acidovorans]|uniref:Lipoprotein n=1 Tax=Sporomusa acidovorans (strain ATCC 49682 / DSM 3132 / Mol) TaxID=1123286 RepID=A0ABZ3J3B1_SPOA4|nr:hypothetical protein [Sporomusa acidovorans]OZC20329.1 hypothetical protein SPACI_27280 [Sporomusa acidovorans DSM 3132]SDD37382.1 hypothetical protein SAMN04488499_100155 [Sporomusa acidovorans]